MDDTWDNWGDDWGNENNNNSQNLQQQISQQNQQYIHQPQQQPTINNAPIYSPFAYQQPQLQANITPATSQQSSFLSTTTHQSPQTYPTNPVNFFNTTHYNESNNSQLHQNNKNNVSAFNSTTHFEKVKTYQQGTSATISTVQFSNSNLPPPPPIQTYSTLEQSNAAVSSSSLPLPPPPSSSSATSISNSLSMQNQQLYDSNTQGHSITHQQQTNFDSNYNPAVSQYQQQQSFHQYTQWNDQRSPQNQLNQNNSELKNFNNNWQATQIQNTFNTSQPANVELNHLATSTNDWQNISTTMQQSSGANFFDYSTDTQPKNEYHQNAQNLAFSPPSVTVSSSQPIQQQQQPPKFENNENIQAPSSESLAQLNLPPTSSTPLYVTSSLNTSQEHDDRQAFEPVYPENRERLDELPSAPTLDRHNYMVTGQLSQEHSPVISSSQVSQSNHEQSFNDSLLPPSGLSINDRMVVGEPENNQQQIPSNRNEVRMVTGNEMTPASYLNYQRQADGEVSSPNVAPIRLHLQQQQQPSFNQQQQVLPPPISQQNIENNQQQSFNISDRNLYLVAGESDVQSQQRVIPGVESDSNNAPMNIINPLQNLHIEDDEDFVNVSVASQHRPVDGDGMEEQQNQLSIDTEQREEDIEGANDNNANAIVMINHPPPPSSSNPVSVHENIVHPPLLNDQESDIREDIEGANDYSDPPKVQQHLLPHVVESHEEKRKSFDSDNKKQKPEMSSEDSELRELEKNVQSKMRRSKKYDSNDSDSDHGHGRKKDKYGDRYKRSDRDRMSRDEYEKFRRREKERRSGGGGGRSRRNDDTDGSRYDSRRRTDDEEDENRRHRETRRSTRSRRDDDREDAIDEKERNREKKDGKKYYDDERRRHRRERERDQYYSSGRPGSQNASDREYDRYMRRVRGSNSAYDGYYQQYGYDTNYNYNSYYQQQQYFENLRRTNPQAYEWYKNYYSGMMQQQQAHLPTYSQVDAIESLRSGYSSSNEKDRASTSRSFLPGGNVSMPNHLGSLNSSFIDNTNDYHSLQTYGVGKDFNQPYASLNLSNQNYGYDMYGDLRVKTVAADVSQSRMTPHKFQCLHGFVSLKNGIMTTIDTLNTDESYLVKLENVPIYDRTRRLFQSYPGPLVRGLSHKKTVIEFCEEKLKQNSHLENGLRASYSLLWSYLILMLRHNGTYTEADISELLMKNSDEFKSLYEMPINETKSVSNNNEGAEDEEDDENKTDVSDSEENVSSERNSNTVSQSQNTSTSVPTEKNVLDKFKNFLLYGNINDALDYATDNNLWGHALFLASKVDRRQHANVMLKFANKLSYNDPLQTLYQIMSGRMPACVTSIDDKFGDWRPHLAMIISNCTDKPELVKRSVITLGDTLLARGDVYGSHFCYLLMDPQFTDYSDTTMANGKIALLGTTIQKPFKEFASNESIIMTEVYEYARSLSSENYFITSLQKYKFLLASNILDFGNQLKCLLYMEQISKSIIQQPELFDANFCNKVYTLADRLKFYDPVMEKSYEDNFNNNDAIEDPKWLQDLLLILQNGTGSSLSQQQYISTSQQQPSLVPTYSPNDMYNPVEYQQKQQPTLYDPMGSQHQTPTHAASAVVQSSQIYEEHGSYQYNYDHQNTAVNNQVPTIANYNQDYMNPYQQQSDQNSFNQNGSFQNENNNQSMIHANNQQQQQHNFMQPTIDQNYSQPQQSDYNSYNSWDQPKPTITMGNASKFDESIQDKGEIVGQSKDEKKSPAKKADDKKQVAQETTTKNASGGGWFSGLFFGKAKSTQMKLPDDKNPSIVWDETTKKWVNKDEDPAEAESFKPPPKMDDLMRKNSQTLPAAPQFQQQPTINQTPMQTQPQQIPQQQQQMMNHVPMQNTQQIQQQTMPQQQQQIQQPIQNITAEQVAGPSMPAAPNMFKMQKGRNLKKSYVDILGNAGHTVSQPKELAPQMDMQFFNPQVQPQGTMQFYNPNDFQ
ncbi:hypothetical protein PVAND_002996 [Polypedilum vanderplanki]|uniref:Sec16 Sec23-binding domain-containing protein n=1 Tax=Polypedilum vanderplanki TaxID=319348 RepID=A0A9J6BSR1_POLVA|nr:hypothetical protein PVAND_002996 [Polypedilum vanderplanki]